MHDPQDQKGELMVRADDIAADELGDGIECLVDIGWGGIGGLGVGGVNRGRRFGDRGAGRERLRGFIGGDSIWFDENSSIGWVRISDVTKSGMYLQETMQHLSALGVQHSRPVGRGSLIMSICATVGRPIITEIDVCIHDGFVVFDDLQVEQLFTYYVLKGIEPNWSKHGQTGSQMNLNTGLISRTEVSIPPTADEQTAIAAALEADHREAGLGELAGEDAAGPTHANGDGVDFLEPGSHGRSPLRKNRRSIWVRD